MTPRAHRIRAALAAAALCAAACRGEPPDVYLFTLDGLRQDHLSAFGYARNTSPNIDRLAAGGIAFRTIIPTGCSTPVSLTSLLTATGATAGALAPGGGLKPGLLTVAEVFQREGYATAGFTATGWLAAELGYGRGFEHYDDFDASRTDATHLADAIVAHIQAAGTEQRPLFVYAHFKEPHPPWTHAEPFTSPREKPVRPFDKGCKFVPTVAQFDAVSPEERADLIARYDASILAADREIGRILDALQSSGRLARSVVAIGTDHGFDLLERFAGSHGRNPYDEVVRTFLVLFDGRSRPTLDTTRIQGRIHDIGPTLLGLAGIDTPEAFEGLDLLSDSDALPAFAYTRCWGAFSVRTLDWKLAGFDLPRRWQHGRAPAKGTYLYDLRGDPGEVHDVQQREREAFASMTRASSVLVQANATEDEGELPAALDDDTKERLRALGYGD